MAAFDLCKGTNCPLKKSCHRYKAKPEPNQTYLLAPPFFQGKCGFYWQHPKPEPLGKSPRFNWDKAHQLHREGLSVRKIAKKLRTRAKFVIHALSEIRKGLNAKR